MLKTKIGMIAIAMLLLVPGGKALASVATPTITVLGDNPATVTVGSSYTDAGATAVYGTTDETASIVTTGQSIDTSAPGTFTVTYNLNIMDGDTPLSATATRTVNVVAPAVTTNDASSITTTDATLSGTLGSTGASNESFWVSTSSFDVSTPNIPAGVYSTPVLDPVAANGSFTDPLSIVTTQGITTGGALVNMPAITPNTTYYYVAWGMIDGTWTHGAIKSFTTATPQSATLILVKHTIGGDATFNFNLTGSTSTSTSITTVEGYATSTIALNVGTTTISEQALDGWTLTSANCVYEGESIGSVIAGNEVITVDNGDTVTCTFNNTSNSVGSITVVKRVVKSDGETYVDDNHTFTVTLGEITKSFSEQASTTFEGLTPGFYTLTEATSSDYDLVSISPDADLELPGVQISVVPGLTTAVTITNKQHATVTPPTNSGNQNNPGGPTGGGNVLSYSQGSVLGASTDTPNFCTVSIDSYMRRGGKNDAEQVKKLQTFLNTQNLGVTIEVNGIFDLQTENAVKLFQEKYATDILSPWGLTKGTGFVYKTTLRWINHLLCPGNPLPPISL